MYDRTQSLMQKVNIDSLKEVYREVMKNGETVEIGVQYGKNLSENLDALLVRMKRGSYFPQSQDWLQRVDVGGRCKKYMVRAFEDKLLQYRFREILKLIYESKIQCNIADLEKRRDIKKQSHGRIEMYVAQINVDFVKLMRKINQENLITFLKQDIADRSFVRYCSLFLQSGVKLLGVCIDSGSDSAIPFLSMFCDVYVCYMLQTVVTAQEWGLFGGMCVRREAKSFCYLFDKVGDARNFYRRLYRGMKEMGYDLSEDKICTLSPVFDNKRQFAKGSLSQRIIERSSNRKVNHVWKKGKWQE